MQQKEIVINGQKIAYYESPGPSTSLRTGPTVVMIHGNSMSGLCFQKQLKSPLGERNRLIAIDLPGHGRSDKAADPQRAYTLPGYAEMLVSFINILGLQKAVFVGYSLGGYIIMEAADRLPASGIVTIGATALDDPSSIPNAFLPNPAFPLAFKADWTEEDIKTFQTAVFGSIEPYDFFRDDIQRTDKRAREVLGESIVPGGFKDEVKVLEGLKIPIAVILGDNDGYINRSYIEGLNIPTLWRGDIQIIPDAGHTPQWEQPERFNSLLDEFINKSYRNEITLNSL